MATRRMNTRKDDNLSRKKSSTSRKVSDKASKMNDDASIMLEDADDDISCIDGVALGVDEENKLDRELYQEAGDDLISLGQREMLIFQDKPSFENAFFIFPES